MSEPTNYDRRTVLTAGVAACTSLTAGCLGIGGSDKSPEKTVFLGGRVNGWIGMYPNAIDGTTNPTLQLTPGTVYKIDWVNLDGKKHELIIKSKNGDELQYTEHATKKGTSRSVTFEATKEMARYICEYHPKSMRGTVATNK